jgi:D-alanine-D-alanine ligase
MTYRTPSPLKVALLCGGTSNERAISLVSAQGVCAVLEASGHEVTVIDTGGPGFIRNIALSGADVAFIALHGTGGEDGCIQGLLELLGLPYTGSGVLASALAMDKQRSKILYRFAGLSTPESVVLEGQDGAEQNEKKALAAIGIPCVIKPVCEGSSLGISIVREAAQLAGALASCFGVCDTALAEAFVAGTEITVSVIGASPDALLALPIIEIVANVGEFYDYESKYLQGGSTHIIPARISATAATAAREAALCAHRLLGCSGVSRSDLFVDKDDRVWLIETNTIPGMTPTSLLPEAARAAGIELADLYDRLLFWALGRPGAEAPAAPDAPTCARPPAREQPPARSPQSPQRNEAF